MKIPSKSRPIHKLISKHWQRINDKIELEGCSVKWNGFFYACKECKSVVGVTAYYCFIDHDLHVFDFSASHLCPNQLKRIEQYANVS